MIESREVTKVKSEFWPSLRRVEILKEDRKNRSLLSKSSDWDILVLTIEPFTDSQLILIYPASQYFVDVEGTEWGNERK